MVKKFGIYGRLALIAAALIWGTSFAILKNTLDSVSTLWILAMRFIIAALMFLAIAGKRLKSMGRKELAGGLFVGVCLAAAYIVQTYGLALTTPSKNAFLTATYCVLVPFMAWGIYKRKPGVNNIFAAVLCISGIGFVALDSGFGVVNLGDILTLICGIFYALQMIVLEQYGSCDTISLSAVEFSTAAVICLVGALIFEPVPTNIPSGAWLSILYMGVFCTGICFFLEAVGLKYTPSSTAAVLMTLESVFGVIFSVILYHEKLNAKLVFGFVLIFVSVLLSEVGAEIGKRLKAKRMGKA